MSDTRESTEWPSLDDTTASRATFLAMCVRNALEGTLHGGELGEISLTDEQMALLNPIVRNAIATGLHAISHGGNPAVRQYIGFQLSLVPSYWEPPELLPDYIEVVGHSEQNSQMCRNCGRQIVPFDADWRHIGEEGGVYVGCRAASFTKGHGWDDALSRSWRATPRG